MPSGVPVPGGQYVVLPGDNLSDIAGIAYGDKAKWRIIWAANKTRLRSGDPNWIFPGEVISIPADAMADALKAALGADDIAGKAPDDFTVIVDGSEIPVQSARAIRTMDTAADGFVFTIPWDQSDAKTTKLLKPYGYQAAQCHLGNKLLCKGILYDMENTASDSGFSKTLHVFSPTADAIDSTMQPPFEFSKMNIKQIADEIIAPLGITVEIDPLVSLPADLVPFDRVTADANQTRFEFLAGLAKQRGLLISNTPQGSLKIWRANTAGAPVDSLEESMPPSRQMSARFEGRKRFNVYQAIGQSPGRKARPKTATSKDDRVPRSRFYTFTSDETLSADIQRAADWQRSKQIAESLTMEFPVSSWYNKAGKLWEENTLVTVKSQTLEVPDGFDFLIRAVEFAFETSGTTAVLSLVPPQAYTEQPIVEPW